MSAEITINLTPYIAEAVENHGHAAITKATQDYLRNELDDVVREAIGIHVEGIVRGALDGKFQPRDRWGNTEGEPTTLHSMLEEHARKVLSEEVTDPERRGMSTYDAPRKPLVAWWIESAVKHVLGDTLRKEVAAAGEEARVAVRAHAAEVIGETIDRARRGLA